MRVQNIIKLGTTTKGLQVLNLEIMKRIGGSPEKYMKIKIANYKVLTKKDGIVIIAWKEKEFYKKSSHAFAVINSLKVLEEKGIPYIFRTGEEETLFKSLQQAM